MSRKQLLVTFAVAAGFLVLLVVLGGPAVVVVRKDYVEKARQVKVKTDLRQILHYAERFRDLHGKYPGSLEEIEAAEENNGGETIRFLVVPRDPWGHEYGYAIVNGKPRALCLGKDGTEGGEGEDGDFVLGGEVETTSAR